MTVYNPPHPGEFIKETYIKPLNISLRMAADQSKPQVARLNRAQGLYDVAAEVESPNVKQPEDVGRIGAQGLQDFLQKAQQAFARGKTQFANYMKGFKGSLTPAHAPAYAPAH